MEDELWSCRDQSRRLNESRSLAASLWQDSVGHDLTMRYLNPHSDEDASMLQEFERQLGDDISVRHRVGEASQAVLGVEARSLECVELIAQFDADLGGSHQYYEYYTQADAHARILCEEVLHLIAQAASICEGVPTK